MNKHVTAYARMLGEARYFSYIYGINKIDNINKNQIKKST